MRICFLRSQRISYNFPDFQLLKAWNKHITPKMDMINEAEIATKSLRERKALNTFSSFFFKSNCE